jgi:hypothetical protein
MSEGAAGALRIDLPLGWDEVDVEVLRDADLMNVLGLPSTVDWDRVAREDIIVLAVLSELIENDADEPIGAVMASLVAVLAPPAPEDREFPIIRREAFGEPVDGLQPWVQVVIHRVSFPQINCDLILQFSTPNLPLLADLEPLFERIAATARFEPAEV